MTCFHAHARFWNSCFGEAFTLPPGGRPHCYSAFPAEGEPEWAQLTPESNLFYAKLKLAGVVILGVAASLLLAGAIALTAAAIVELSAEIFSAFALLSLEWIGQSIIPTLGSIVVFVLLGIGIAYEIFAALASTVIAIAIVWSKMVIPNIHRGSAYFHHQELRR